MFKNSVFRSLVLLPLLLSLHSLTAYAGAGDPCTVADKIYTAESPSGPSLICNGTTLEVLQSAKGNPVAKGIGTDTPVTLLTVENATAPVVTIGSTNNNGTPAIRLIENMSGGASGNKGFELVLDGANNEMRIDRYENAFVSTLVTFDRDNDFVRIDGELGIGKDPASGVSLDINGSIEYVGTITDISDRRLKSDISALPHGQLDKILKLKPVSFKMKERPQSTKENGFIAQDVQNIFPSLVLENPQGMLSMNYIGLIAPMVEAIKEQNTLIQNLERQNDRLLKRVEALENRRD